MALVRLFGIGSAGFLPGAGILGCPKSATLSLDSTVLRAKCGNSISERYQGITGLSVEVVVETINPFASAHPGMFGTLKFGIPAAAASGFPGTMGVVISVDGVITQTVRRITRNDLASGSYTLRGISVDGKTCPITFSPPSAMGDEGAGPADFIRDIAGFGFASVLTAEDFCMESLEVTEASTMAEDSCQGQLWPTYIGVSGLNITVTATGKGIKAAFDAAAGGTTCLGKKGIITITVAVGSATDCAAIVVGGGMIIARANVTALTITATTGEVAKITLTWTAHGEAGEATDPEKRAWITTYGSF